MCGRFTARLTWEQIHSLYNITPLGPRQAELDLKPRYNAAPTDVMPVCRLNRQGQREIAMLKWGLIPYWATDPKIGYRTINARAETVATAPAFREAFKRRRCLVPANGFYEWKKIGNGEKQPYLVAMRDGSPFSFAGLWERWKKGEGSIETFTIITGEPNSLLAELHDRMPVILDPDEWDAWLTANDAAILQAMLRPFPAQLMTAYPVSKRVGNVRNDDPSLIEPMKPVGAPDDETYRTMRGHS
jgi:putative SOS response-associated peptidase YedK